MSAVEALSRDPARLPPELPRGSQLPPDHDPLADGILMDHQKSWLEDESPLKVCAKGRRTGITYAEALDDTIIAASDRMAGGDNIFYIGDTKDKGREFIDYVAHFAKVVQGELLDVEEFLFEDEKPDGSTRYISAFRVRFRSGYRVEALSSRPENIRGLQGIVVIDEAAYHKNVREVLDAVNALLIWGGKVRVISTHDGLLNPFNELITEAKAGKNNFSVHEIPFQAAIDNGLYDRVCLIKREEPTEDGRRQWEETIRGSYGTRISKMQQELDAIPADAEGAALSRVEIERCTSKDLPVVRWSLKDNFRDYEKEIREAAQRDWCERHLKDVLAGLDTRRSHVFGFDFARSGDASALKIFEIGQDLVRRAVLTVEMRNVPFDQQRDLLFYVVERLPRFAGGACDATGNGAYLAEAAALEFGDSIVEVKLSQAWYQENAPAYTEAFADQTVVLAADEDVVRDHQALQYVGGIIKVPDDHRHKGEDGEDRHGDTAIAGMLAWFASRQNFFEYGYESARPGAEIRGANRPGHERRERGLTPKLRGHL